MSFGNNGGSSTTVQEIPQWLRDEYQQNIDRAENVANNAFQSYGGQRVAGDNMFEDLAQYRTLQAADMGQGQIGEASRRFSEAGNMSPLFVEGQQAGPAAARDAAQIGDVLDVVPDTIAGTHRAGYENPYIDSVLQKSLQDIDRSRQMQIDQRDRYGLEPDWSLYRPKVYLHRPPGAPVIPFQDHVQEDEPEGEPVTVCVIGDAHDAPHLRDKSRFRWLGAFCEEHGVDRVVQIGDWWTMDCFSSHTDRATFEGLAKPTFEQDRESFHESQQAFQDGLAGHRPKKDVTLGNHELRAWRYDNLHPDGVSHGQMVEEAFAQWGWRTTPYGQYRFIENVGFVHVPLNGMGKPMGGVTGGQRSANAAMFDIVHGDSHKSQTSVAEKVGPVRAPTIYNAATALPPGFIEGFANKGGSTWRSGVCLATLWGSYVRSWQFTEMILLKRRYG